MKVYCEDCEHYQKLTDIRFGELTNPHCWHNKNAEKNKERDKKYPDRIQGLWAYVDYIIDVYDFKRKPKEINKDNDCSWFEMTKCKWWQWKKRKRFELRYSLQKA